MTITVMRPIWPSAATEAWYHKQLDDLLRAASQDLSTDISQAWVEKPPEIGLAQDADTPVSNLERVLSFWDQHWSIRLDHMAREIAAQFAARAKQATEYSMMHALKAAGFAIQFQPTAKSMEAYRAVLAENVGLIKSISQRYHTDVREKVWSAVRVGGDLSTLSQDLRETYGVSVRRAALIARDQSAKSKAVIEGARRQELGITQAVWVHSAAGKEPRPEHVRWSREHKVFDIAKGMYSKEDGEFIWPGTPINCRCSSMPVIRGIAPEYRPATPAELSRERQRQREFRQQLGYA